ncbi:MAG: tape measure protein [Pirellulales bacterium]
MAAKDIEAGRAHVLIQLRDKVTGALTHVERKVAGFGRNFASMGAAFAATGAGALAWPLKVSADMESLGIRFESLLGSADGAKAMMKELSTFARNSPFDMKGVSDAAAELIQARVATNDVLPDLTALGNAAAGDKDKFDRLTYAFAQTAGLMKLTGDNARQMNEAGFSPIATIAEATGRGITDLTEAMHRGEISMDLFRNSLRAVYGPGGRLGDLMEKQSKTLGGLTTALMDAISMGLKPIGDAAAAVLKPLAKFAIGAAEAFQAFAEKNQGVLKVVAGVLLGLVAVGGVIAAVGFGALALSTVFGGLAAVASAIAGAIGFLFSPLGAVLVALTAAGVAAWYFRDRIITAIQPIVTALQPMVAGVMEIWSVFSQAFGGIVDNLMSGQLEAAAGLAWTGFVAVAWTAIEQLGSAINVGLDFLQTWIPGVDVVRDYLRSAFGSIGDAILAGRWDLAGQIIMAKLQLAWTNGIDILRDAWDIFIFGNKMAWRAMSDFIVDMWNGAVNGIARGITWIMEKIGVAADGTLQELNRIQAAEDKARQKERNARDNPMQQMADRMMARERSRRDQQANINKLEREAAQARQQNGGATIASVAAAARADLTKAIAASKEVTTDSQKKAQPLMNQIAASGSETSKIASAGTFSAAGAAQSLGINGRPAEETARNTAGMLRWMKQQQRGQAQFA